MAMWSDDESRDDRIDRAIDAVARQMTEGTPDAGFKARVLARVSADRGPYRRLVWIASPLAAAAIVFLILFIRTNRDRDRAIETSPPPPPVVAQMDREPPNSHAAKVTPPARANVRPPREARKQVVAPSEIDALAPRPLEVDSIALSEIEPASSLDMQRLETITPIELAPIGEGDRP